ncbi:MAG: hypothetical protein ARM1_0612 [Candidatus Micrarchaeota archaeon]|nr:MAG: hypothetical protein ARM1_0612 [Candidatus Micrarchaeota archaeon]
MPYYKILMINSTEESEFSIREFYIKLIKNVQINIIRY